MFDDGFRRDSPSNQPLFELDDWRVDVAFAGAAPKIEWLIEGIMPLGIGYLFAARGGTGKTSTLINMGFELTDPDAQETSQLLGASVAKTGRAILIIGEDNAPSVHRFIEAIDPDETRRKRIGDRLKILPAPELECPIPLIRGRSGAYETTEAFGELRRQIEREAEKGDLVLVGIDPMQVFVLTETSHANEAAQHMWSELNALAANFGCTIAVTHHFRKEGQGAVTNIEGARQAIRGASGLVDGARGVYCMWEPPTKDAKNALERMGESYEEHKLVDGALVKSNFPGDCGIRHYIRSEGGILIERTDAIRSVMAEKHYFSLLNKLEVQDEVNKRRQAGNPFSAAVNTPRSLVRWLVLEHEIELKEAKKRVWNMVAGGLLIEELDKHTKAKGLRVGKSADSTDIPPAEEDKEIPF